MLVLGMGRRAARMSSSISRSSLDRVSFGSVRMALSQCRGASVLGVALELLIEGMQ